MRGVAKDLVLRAKDFHKVLKAEMTNVQLEFCVVESGNGKKRLMLFVLVLS